MCFQSSDISFSKKKAANLPHSPLLRSYIIHNTTFQPTSCHVCWWRDSGRRAVRPADWPVTASGVVGHVTGGGKRGGACVAACCSRSEWRAWTRGSGTRRTLDCLRFISEEVIVDRSHCDLFRYSNCIT